MERRVSRGQVDARGLGGVTGVQAEGILVGSGEGAGYTIAMGWGEGDPTAGGMLS